MIVRRSACWRCRQLAGVVSKTSYSSSSSSSAQHRPAPTLLRHPSHTSLPSSHQPPQQCRTASTDSHPGTADKLADDVAALDKSLSNQLHLSRSRATLEMDNQRRDEMQRRSETEDVNVDVNSQAKLDTAPKTGDSYAVAAYRRALHIRETTGSLGANIAPHYQPRSLIDNPPTAADLTLEMLLAAQAHLGHATALWKPANARYIFGIRQGVHIIALEQTAAHLKRAARVVQGVAERGGLVLFVGTRPGQEPYITRAAKVSGQYHLFENWIPGTITNGIQTLRNCGVMAVDAFDNAVPALQRKLHKYPTVKPDLIVCCNVLENYVMLHEAGLAGVPTIGIVDTNVDATWVTYPIPANDDSLRTIGIVAGVLGNAARDGRDVRLANAAQGNVFYSGIPGLKAQLEEDQEQRKQQEQEEAGAGATKGPDMKLAETIDAVDARPPGPMGVNPPGPHVAEHVRGVDIKGDVPRPRRQQEAEDRGDDTGRVG